MTRDPNRIDVMLARLGDLWKKNTDLRFGQLVLSLARGEYSEDLACDLRDVEDDNMMVRINARCDPPETAEEWSEY